MRDTTASAYIKNGRLCIVGLQESEVGPVPFTHVVDIGEEVEDGPVSFGAEDPVISTAIQRAREPMMSKVEEEKMKIVAGQWVDRARAGDQNAMALISGVRVNAQKGSERAKKAARFLGEYIRANPVNLTDGTCKNYLPQSGTPDKALIQKLSQFKGDDGAVSAWTPALSKKDPYLAAVVLADGPQMTHERIVNIGSHFGEEKQDFLLGVKSWNIKEPIRSSDAFIAGKAIGHTRALQGVRAGACPVSYLCRVSGWELGED